MKRRACALLILFGLMFGGALAACSNEPFAEPERSDTESENATEKVTQKESEKMTEEKTTQKPKDRAQILADTKFTATEYNVDEIKNADKTAAGSFDAWKNEVFKGKNNNDDPTENAVINSPFHTLRVNGESVPVYTARCGKGAHSFAWIDITSKDSEFILELELVEVVCI